MKKLLDVQDLHVSFKTKFGKVNAVNGVSFHVNEGEVMAVVGESGSGKSVMSMSMLKLIAKNGRIDEGKILFNDNDLVLFTENEMKSVRGGDISMVFQDPMTCLNPVFTIGNQMEEALKFHKKDMGKAERNERMIEMLDKVGISNPHQRLKQYPHELSGGMRQRVMIAISLLCQPKLLIADEPTTALDVTIQAQIMDLMKELCREYRTSVILITHNLGVVAGMADRVMVMYGGSIMESATLDDLYYKSMHPYTQGLLAALPKLNMGQESLKSIPGSSPDLLLDYPGCMFFDRCDYAMECCKIMSPPVYEMADNHLVKCWRCHPEFKEEA